VRLAECVLTPTGSTRSRDYAPIREQAMADFKARWMNK
jgi:hypothetical protein